MSTPVKNWVANHDERWSFILLYVVGAVLLSVFASLFWVAMLALLHFGIEIWRHYIIEDEKPILLSLWQVKLDIALILFALVIGLYSEIVMGALGLGQAARGAQIVSRFAIIERGLRIFFLTVDDFTRISLILWRRVVKKQNGKTGKDMQRAVELLEQEEEKLHPVDESKLSKGDIFSLSFGALCLILLIISPYFTGDTALETVQAILAELSPL